jgi:hypothetical protein
VASPGEMSSISFNCRGAGNNPTVRELSVISQVWSLRLFFLCETRQSVNKMRRLRHRLGLKGLLVLIVMVIVVVWPFFGMRVFL